jgi:uncharacterized protein YjiS (DUF1127 family)
MSVVVACVSTSSLLAESDWLDRRERRSEPSRAAGGPPRGAPRVAFVAHARAAWLRFVARSQLGPAPIEAPWVETAAWRPALRPKARLRLVPPRDGVRIAGGPAARAASMLRAWQRRRRIEAGISALRELDDRMLRDIGLERADVVRACRTGLQGD